MSLIIREIKTADAINAVNRIKSIVKNNGLGLNFDVSKEFLEKRKYMQSDEFLKDEHNSKMLDLGEKLALLREKIGHSITERNKTAKDELIQGINGFVRIKKYLNANPKMNFSETQTFHTPEENEYSLLRRFKIGNLVRQAKNQLGLK